jgi:hypothetical protein
MKTSRKPAGSFENGAGLFASTCEDQGQTMRSIGIWDRIGVGLCRLREVCSADDGKTWAHDWVKHWRRVG